MFTLFLFYNLNLELNTTFLSEYIKKKNHILAIFKEIRGHIDALSELKGSCHMEKENVFANNKNKIKNTLPLLIADNRYLYLPFFTFSIL